MSTNTDPWLLEGLVQLHTRPAEGPCPICGYERDEHTDAQAEACGEAE